MASRRLAIAAIALALLAVVARTVVHYAAEVSVKTAFYEGLGMGGAYATRWQWTIFLGLIGLVLALLLSLPVLYLLRRPKDGSDAGRPSLVPDSVDDINWDGPTDEAEPQGPTITPENLRVGLRIGWLLAFLLLASLLMPGLAALRDPLLAAFNRTPFGVDDPIFGRDVSFFVFLEPAISDIVGLLTGALALATLAAVGTGVALWVTERRTGSWLESRVILERTQTVGFALGGLFLLGLAIALWLSRYQMTIGGDEVIAGAGAAARDIDIPTRAVMAVLFAILSLGVIALGVPRVRRRVARLTVREVLLGILLLWTLAVLAMIVLATPWWTVLLLPLVPAVVALGARSGATGARGRTGVAAGRRHRSNRHLRFGPRSRWRSPERRRGAAGVNPPGRAGQHRGDLGGDPTGQRDRPGRG